MAVVEIVITDDPADPSRADVVLTFDPPGTRGEALTFAQEVAVACVVQDAPQMAAMFAMDDDEEETIRWLSS